MNEFDKNDETLPFLYKQGVFDQPWYGGQLQNLIWS